MKKQSPLTYLYQTFMRFFNLKTRFKHGMFAGKRLEYLIETNQTFYIDAYILEVSEFYIYPETIQEIKSRDPNFFISDEALKKLDEKYAKWKEEFDKHRFERTYSFSNNEHENFRYYNDDLD